MKISVLLAVFAAAVASAAPLQKRKESLAVVARGFHEADAYTVREGLEKLLWGLLSDNTEGET